MKKESTQLFILSGLFAVLTALMATAPHVPSPVAVTCVSAVLTLAALGAAIYCRHLRKRFEFIFDFSPPTRGIFGKDWKTIRAFQSYVHRYVRVSAESRYDQEQREERLLQEGKPLRMSTEDYSDKLKDAADSVRGSKQHYYEAKRLAEAFGFMTHRRYKDYLKDNSDLTNPNSFSSNELLAEMS